MSTPVQRQYWELKKQNPEAMLFFRLGDFYELFYEDAHIASKLLGIALTARHRDTENEMPMCGFPYHAHQEYLEKLIEAGYKVAVAEQIEGEDGKITRSIDRVITPGTTLENGNLDPYLNNYLLSLSCDDQAWALAYCDLSTGEFQMASFASESDFWEEVFRIKAREILVSPQLFETKEIHDRCGGAMVTPQPKTSTGDLEKILKKHFGVYSLEAFGLEQIPILLEAVGRVISYLTRTQRSEIKHLKKVQRYSTDDVMLLDQQSFQHLEIFQPNFTSQKGGTLQSVLERPHTAMGGRQLHRYLLKPLINQEKILARQSGVRELYEDGEQAQALANYLKAMPDLERLLSRLATGRGNARDALMMGEGLSHLPDIAILLQKSSSDILKSKSSYFKGLNDLSAILLQKIVENPPLEITEGGLFRSGVDAKLDELRALSEEAESWLETFLESEKKRSGISTIRLKYSKNFGFCLEVSQAQAAQAPDHWTRRQTLVNAERFTTPELAEYESKVLSAKEEACELEYQLFGELRNQILTFIEPLQLAAKALGEIDALLALALTARKHRWCCPEISGNKGDFVVEGARHPVVESILAEPFIKNDLLMNNANILHIITGPNMAGKSTFLRQNAILIFLAQIGSYVPARSVKMPVFDRIFTRVGASDHLAAGKSTFYLEMSEMAHILHQVTDRSFVILDEIGRGTSTFDGLSLAWAITEYLHDEVGCKTLLATHYHELIDLGDQLRSAVNYHVSVTQDSEGITFLRTIKPGGISDSFGIEVARSAGIPDSVITQARVILSKLEAEDLLGQPKLFDLAEGGANASNANNASNESALEEKLRSINPDELSPKEALEVLYDLTRSLEA